jgi:hypothetical protein
MAEPTRFIYNEATVVERITRVEERLIRLDEKLEEHTKQDESNFQEIRTSLNSLDGKVDQLLLAAAHTSGREAESQKASKFEGGKWGAIVGGFIAGLIWAVKAFIGH